MIESKPGSSLVIRRAGEADLMDLMAMADDFVRGHPAEHHARSPDQVRAAYLGTDPVAHLLVAVRNGRVVGMMEWARIFDLFWAMVGGRVEWLYVRPEARGLGIPAALAAAACDEVRRAGGEFIRGGSGEDMKQLYERVAIGRPTRECAVAAEAFQVLADLAGKPPREVVRGLPDPELNRVPARPRAPTPARVDGLA